jgi:hypothetical protein
LGRVCELYRISDVDIDELSKLSYEESENFLDEKYACVDGELHHKNDTVFSMDKGWDIVKFLLKKVAYPKHEILNQLDTRFIKSKEVKLIHKTIKDITIDDIMKVLNIPEMIEQKVYKAGVDDKNYINYHLKTYKTAFKKASELNNGIVIHFY